MTKSLEMNLLYKFSKGKKLSITRIDENALNPDLYRDCLEQGFLPGTAVQILANFKSQNKLIAKLSEQSTVAVPYSLAEKIYVQYD
ncbi:MAG: ferrous iron transport protein A [Leptospira sp.]|jgi:Fe2+ transport system protein FeoA|nr:ferrous iron transport protein A [Leptospira sp.]NCS95269.1 ferrous iron transport protein A [Leptospira sp.]